MLLPLLATVLLVLTARPVHAAPPGDSSYIAMQVPDLPRAIRFFQDVMHCAPIDPAADMSQTALLDCGNGTVVALAIATGRGRLPVHAPANVIPTDDALATAAWLRVNHLRIIGRPERVSEGPGMDEIVVTFLTPWGQPLQLVSHARALPIDTRLAAQ